LSAKLRKHPSKMCVPRTYMSEENYVKSEANNCTEIIVPLYIEFVTNL